MTFCGQCGAQNFDPTAASCTGCGAPLTSSAPQSDFGAQQQYAPPPDSFGGPPPVAPYSYAGRVGRGSDEPVSVGDFFVSYIVVGIPIVGIIMLFVWAFSANTKKSKSNWAKAFLIYILIGVILWFLFASLFAAAFATMFYW